MIVYLVLEHGCRKQTLIDMLTREGTVVIPVDSDYTLTTESGSSYNVVALDIKQLNVENAKETLQQVVNNERAELIKQTILDICKGKVWSVRYYIGFRCSIIKKANNIINIEKMKEKLSKVEEETGVYVKVNDIHFGSDAISVRYVVNIDLAVSGNSEQLAKFRAGVRRYKEAVIAQYI